MSTKSFLCTALIGSLMLLPACSAERRTANTMDENAAETVNATAAAEAASDIEIPDWVTSKAGPHDNCPLDAAAGTTELPGFNFNGTTDARDYHCHQTGPFDWENKVWYVQRIHSLTTLSPNPRCADAGLAAPCLFDGTRVCSKQGANSPTPAGTTAGGGGCGVYEASVKMRPRP